MGSNKQIRTGFTIIEVMLFLGISALLFVGIISSWRNSVDRHRYNDTVSTVKSDFQRIFSDVESPVNSVSKKFTCKKGASNISLSEDDQSGNEKGTSNCVLLGKYVRLVNDAKTDSGYFKRSLRVSDVIGLDIDVKKDCGGECWSSIQALRATKLVVADGDNINNSKDINVGSSFSGNNIGTGETINLEWKAFIRSVTFNDYDAITGNNSFTGQLMLRYDDGHLLTGILILRSPLDGSIMTFAMPKSADLFDGGAFGSNSWMINDYISRETLITSNKKVYFCVAPNKSGQAGAAGSSILGRGKNKIIAIGGTSSSVEVLPLDGSKESWCTDDKIAPIKIEGVNKHDPF